MIVPDYTWVKKNLEKYFANEISSVDQAEYVQEGKCWLSDIDSSKVANEMKERQKVVYV